MLKKLLLALALACTAFGQNPNTAVFPGGVATDSDLLVAANRAGSNLSSGINATTLTIPVASSASFIVPTVITVENEYIKICTKGSGVLNACMGGRAFDASTAATHASGTVVNANATRYYFNQLAAEVKAIEANTAANVMTTLGDTIYGGASGVQTRLAGNTTATRKFFSQTGNSLISAAPAWLALVSGDIPNNAADTTGTASKATQLASTPTFTGCSVIKTVTSIDAFGNLTCQSITTADSTHIGLLSAADWSTFNGKESALTFSLPLVRTVNTISLTLYNQTIQNEGSDLAQEPKLNFIGPTVNCADGSSKTNCTFIAKSAQITLIVTDFATTGVKACSTVEIAYTIVAAHLISNALPTGANLVLDVKKVAFTSYTGTASASSIVASAPPTIATSDSNPRYEDVTLTGWTTSLSANDVICVAVTTAPTGGSVWASLTLEVN